jgi:hypothetical protein
MTRPAPAHIDQINAEAGGVLAIDVVRTVEVMAIAEAAQDGDITAQRRIVRYSYALREFEAQAQVPCLLCSRPVIGLPEALVLAYALRDDPRHALTSAVCLACCTGLGLADLQERVLARFRAHPGFQIERVLPPISEPPGHG